MRLIDRIDTSPGEAGAAVPGGLARAWRELLGSTAARRRGDLIDPHRQGALNRRLLVLLVLARLVMAGTGIAALLIWGGGIAEFPLLRVSLVLLAMGGLSYFVQTALMRAAPPSESTFLAQLLGDLALLSYAVYETGGVDNPFTAFFLVPLTLAAYALSIPRLLAFVATTAVCLLLLYRFHVEVGVFSEVMHEVSELIIVSVVTYFAYAVARLSRTHERAVARARENAYELRQGRLPPADRGEALDVLEQQVQACKRSLSELLASVGHARGEGGTQRGVDAMLFAVARECELLDPRVSVLFEPIAPAPPKIVEERALFDAFALLFKHCARSAPHNVQVAVHWDSDFLTLTLRNAQSPLRAARKTPYPLQGGTGAGGGLVLAASLLARFGATLAQLGDQDDSRLQVQLPMAAIGAAPPAGTKALRTGESLQELS